MQRRHFEPNKREGDRIAIALSFMFLEFTI
jgi:hypothetical protein